MFNYRNTCLADGDFSSERVFKFKPKTALDLVNPKKSFKKQLVQPSQERNVENTVSGQRSRRNLDIQPGSAVDDPFSNLVTGDKVYYRNNKITSTERWLEAIFIKKISTNIFQISLGSHLISAHKGQIRLAGQEGRRRKVVLRRMETDGRRGTKRQRTNSDDEPPCLGLSPSPARDEVHTRALPTFGPTARKTKSCLRSG